jgi:hypothetical protein
MFSLGPGTSGMVAARVTDRFDAHGYPVGVQSVARQRSEFVDDQAGAAHTVDMGAVVYTWAYQGVTWVIEKLCDLWLTRRNPETPGLSDPNAAPVVGSYLR